MCKQPLPRVLCAPFSCCNAHHREASTVADSDAPMLMLLLTCLYAFTRTKKNPHHRLRSLALYFDRYVTPTSARPSLRNPTSSPFENVNVNHLRYSLREYTRKSTEVVRKAVLRSEVKNGNAWSVEEGKTFYSGHTDHAICVHSLGSITATASRDMTVRLWYVRRKRP